MTDFFEINLFLDGQMSSKMSLINLDNRSRTFFFPRFQDTLSSNHERKRGVSSGKERHFSNSIFLFSGNIHLASQLKK